jgi:ABC-type dipeptide/oligopeptide/nickel transport system permease subunit
MHSLTPESTIHESKDSLWSTFSELRENRGALVGFFVLLVVAAIALLAPMISPYDPSEVHEGLYRLPPFWSEGANRLFLLGTDDVGRDLLSRLLYGARVSLGVGLLGAVVSSTLGTLLGLLAGYFGGWVNEVILRSMDILMALPSLLLAIVIVTLLGPGLINAVLATSVVALPHFTRIVRSSVIVEKEKNYVLASRTFGASHFHQIFWNILPNCMGPLIVQTTFSFSDAILNVSALGFLGLGAQPPTAEWGTMLADARPFIESAPWLVTLPGLGILIVVLAFNLMGDGLRDLLDPKLKRS